jgi:hypothetical protein
MEALMARAKADLIQKVYQQHDNMTKLAVAYCQYLGTRNI